MLKLIAADGRTWAALPQISEIQISGITDSATLDVYNHQHDLYGP